jgi:hypothetical protein
VSGSSLPARKQVAQSASELSQLDAMAQLARETNAVVHVVLPRAQGVVEHARATANKFGLECYADMRGRSIRIRFTP